MHNKILLIVNHLFSLFWNLRNIYAAWWYLGVKERFKKYTIIDQKIEMKLMKTNTFWEYAIFHLN